eukprot:4524329-Prymnesium_polylepis.1
MHPCLSSACFSSVPRKATARWPCCFASQHSPNQAPTLCRSFCSRCAMRKPLPMRVPPLRYRSPESALFVWRSQEWVACVFVVIYYLGGNEIDSRPEGEPYSSFCNHVRTPSPHTQTCIN